METNQNASVELELAVISATYKQARLNGKDAYAAMWAARNIMHAFLENTSSESPDCVPDPYPIKYEEIDISLPSEVKAESQDTPFVTIKPEELKEAIDIKATELVQTLTKDQQDEKDLEFQTVNSKVPSQEQDKDWSDFQQKTPAVPLPNVETPGFIGTAKDVHGNDVAPMIVAATAVASMSIESSSPMSEPVSSPQTATTSLEPSKPHVLTPEEVAQARMLELSKPRKRPAKDSTYKPSYVDPTQPSPILEHKAPTMFSVHEEPEVLIPEAQVPAPYVPSLESFKMTKEPAGDNQFLPKWAGEYLIQSTVDNKFVPPWMRG